MKEAHFRCGIPDIVSHIVQVKVACEFSTLESTINVLPWDGTFLKSLSSGGYQYLLAGCYDSQPKRVPSLAQWFACIICAIAC
eukprot:2342134-Amphidinium_carterae.1